VVCLGGGCWLCQPWEIKTINKRFLILILFFLFACDSARVQDAAPRYRAYLPIVVGRPKTSPIIGVWIDGAVSSQVAYVDPGGLVEISTRYNGVKEAQKIQALGHPIIIGVHSEDPEQYRLWASLKPEYIEVLSNGFLNEPEVYMTPDQYASLLRSVYPIVKSISPTTIILAGALISPPNGWFERVYRIAPYSFDAVSFHHYVMWKDISTTALCQNAKYLRQYGKPVFLTETAVRCQKDCGNDFYSGQVAYYKAVISSGCVDMFGWYTIYGNGWDNTDMVFGSPRPVWYEYRRQGTYEKRYP
jgi:hypothetical protein